MDNINKILVINFGGIGDEIFFLPSLISLKKEFPQAEITLALEPRSKSVKDLTDVINDLILVDVKGKSKYLELLKLIFKARAGHFDMVISSGGNKLISILLWLTGIKKRYGYYTGVLSEKLLTKAVSLNKNQYACDMYHDLVKPVTNHKTALPEINVQPVKKIPNSVLIHPGVSKMSVQKGMIKTIGAKTWAEIIDLLLEKGKHVILAGGPDDKECIETIRASVKNKNFDDFFGKTKSLKELGELIAKAEQFICSDSAPLHVAVALKTKTYVIFGPTDDKKLIPQSENVIAVKAKDNCPVKPCLWEHRQTTCESLDCLRITAEDVAGLIS
ncbi:MAG: glycosyltransferase family 9 protein [Brachyspira sp.]|jgi:gll3112 protein|nr:glycosyltransferase family 9 protein [Brachyspira sp.]